MTPLRAMRLPIFFGIADERSPMIATSSPTFRNQALLNVGLWLNFLNPRCAPDIPEQAHQISLQKLQQHTHCLFLKLTHYCCFYKNDFKRNQFLVLAAIAAKAAHHLLNHSYFKFQLSEWRRIATCCELWCSNYEWNCFWATSLSKYIIGHTQGTKSVILN